MAYRGKEKNVLLARIKRISVTQKVKKKKVEAYRTKES